MSKYIFLLLPLIICCGVSKVSYSIPGKAFIPPNGFKIDSILFIDKTEIRNIDWKEYQHWTKSIFGKESSKFKNTIPDTNVWLGKTSLDTMLTNEYYRNAKYDEFPVVGVTQDQAKQFSNWRTDRVFEMILIMSGIIEPSFSKQNFKNHFTIENYYSGNYFDYKPDTSITMIPKFVLPSKYEIELIGDILLFNEDQYFEDCDEEFCSDCSKIINRVNSKNSIMDNIKLFNSPTRPVNIDCKNISILEVHNIIGNVSEWTSEDSLISGSNWNEEILKYELKFDLTKEKESSVIGFRNICKFEKVEYAL